MYRLLIVDDEIEIADELYELFCDLGHPELDVYRTYSSKAALEIFNKIKIDILLTDIKMPGMSGLQLAEAIKENWPECRVIFLTGYEEFDFIYKAVQFQDINYLLKNEKDEKIIESVKNAIYKIENDLKNEDLINKAKHQLDLALPLLRQEYLTDLFYGHKPDTEISQSRFDQLALPFKTDIPMMMLVGRFDGMMLQYEKTQQFFTLKLFVEKYFPKGLNYVGATSDSNSYVWLIQPGGVLAGETEKGFDVRQWDNMEDLVKGALESVQTACRKALHTTVSFAVSSEPFLPCDIHEKYVVLKKLINCRIGTGTEMLLSEDSVPLVAAEENAYTFEKASQTLIRDIGKISLLEEYLELDYRKEFFEILFILTEPLRKITSRNSNIAQERYYSIALVFLRYINQWNLGDKIAFRTGLGLLMHADLHETWQAAVEYLFLLAGVIFDIQKKEQDNRAKDVVSNIQQFIRSNIDKQLSLVMLAEIVHFNPSYLSRFFKQMTGTNIMDYILNVRIEKARELLKDDGLKINDIAAKVGYESSNAFIRFFKKAVGATPQEYREVNRKK